MRTSSDIKNYVDNNLKYFYCIALFAFPFIASVFPYKIWNVLFGARPHVCYALDSVWRQRKGERAMKENINKSNHNSVVKSK